MSLAHCADLVEQGDPDRFLVTRGAPAAARARLLPLYALNLEIARAAWASAEPLVAEMRLQWWHDALEEIGRGAPARAHPVLAACGFLSGDAEGVAVLQAQVEARRWDIWREPFADRAALWSHLDAVGGGLMWLAARALGAGPEAEPVVRDFGAAHALAGWLRAVPELEARGAQPLPDGGAEAVAAVAGEGLARIARARAGRGAVPAQALPAMMAGWQAGGLLAQAVREPARVARGALGISEFSRRGRLVWIALTGRW